MAINSRSAFQLLVFSTFLFFSGIFLLFSVHSAQSATVRNEEIPGFTLHKLGTGEGPTLLVVGGIQGDEPGGFSAASLLVTHYNIKNGSVWVVPNLNFQSIVYRHRGLHGDMNRKFAALPLSDPEYDTVHKIQEIILDKKVDLVLNMHDGSGFYRPKAESNMYNPSRWGQCIVIDQEVFDHNKYGQLKRIAGNVSSKVNGRLLNASHAYHIKNTNTRGYDHEMEKSLSYFAICNGKPAFGIEASKELSADIRAHYHLRIIEGFMQELGIEFTRNFSPSPKGVLSAINSNVHMNLYHDHLVLPLNNARKNLSGHIPAQKDADLAAVPSNPLLAVVRGPDNWRVTYGNRTLTRLVPVFMDFDYSLKNLDFIVDGQKKSVRIGETITVNKDFLVKSVQGYRVNAIGAQMKPGNASECDVLMGQKDFSARYSLDEAGSVYRVELYKDNAFAGMVLVRFGPEQASIAKEPLTAIKGAPESNLGR